MQLGPTVLRIYRQVRALHLDDALKPSALSILELTQPDKPALYAHSCHVLPKPLDWPEWTHITGYWFLERQRDWQPPEPLAAFLRSGPPPVYVGFGSISNRDPARTTQIVLDALRLSGQCGVIATGWGGLSGTGLPADLPDDISAIESIPHDWLFPRVAAVIHHGGAGTTAAGLRAGVPSVIVPHFGDQPFWGWRILELGAGPEPIPRRRLTAERLAAAIRKSVENREMRTRAAALGAKIRAEDGVGEAGSGYLPVSQPHSLTFEQLCEPISAYDYRFETQTKQKRASNLWLLALSD